MCRWRPMIRPSGNSAWITLEPGSHKRQVNGILGLLCREHFPGMVPVGGRSVLATMFDHYAVVEDFPDREGRVYANKAERVLADLWDFYRCEPGQEARAAMVARTVCKKRVTDLRYEARIQAIIDYHAAQKVKIKKPPTKLLKLTREQYLSVIFYWCASHPAAWAAMVDIWCHPDWEEKHAACRGRRLKMRGPAHHQGSLSLDGTRPRWRGRHEGGTRQEAWAVLPQRQRHRHGNYSLALPDSSTDNERWTEHPHSTDRSTVGETGPPGSARRRDEETGGAGGEDGADTGRATSAASAADVAVLCLHVEPVCSAGSHGATDAGMGSTTSQYESETFLPRRRRMTSL
ncbi:hypothetical protein ACP70R_009252 [Stipagrostis hirtigluma subsp. patula]